jgi:hypothetical protein
MRKFSLFLVACGFAACSNTTSSNGGGEADAVVDAATDGSDVAADAAGTDAVNDTASDALADTVADVAPDTASDVAPSDAADTGETGEYGFPVYRKSVDTKVTCSKPGPMATDGTYPYADWLCTFAHGGTKGYVYVQNTPKDCTCMMTCTPAFASQGWVSIDGKVTPLNPVGYDWGGNHNNDSLEFAVAGKTYKAYHSSFGFGWRKCQPMDCLQVEDQIAGTVSEDGCTKDRTLPIACVPIAPDGTHAALTDTFKPCLGDPNYP